MTLTVSRLVLAFGLLLGTLGTSARADQALQFSVDEENDKFGSSDDRHFTQGLRLSLLYSPDQGDDSMAAPYGWLSNTTPFFTPGADDTTRKWEAILGQSLFTPSNLAQKDPTQRDRPYAGWLYGGLSLLQQNGPDALENFEVLAGIVGPAALGRQTQNDFHQFIQVGQAQGWGDQLKDEPGLVLTYERKWRFELPIAGNLGVDAIPELGVTAGNVFDYGEAGLTVRLGQNLKVDYGPTRIRPSLSGTGWFDAARLDGSFGWYVFAGVQGRAIGRNIFLDGNTFANSRSVDKKPLVGDQVVGARLFWSDAIRVDFSVVSRTKEFYGPRATDDRFGTINLAIAL